MENTKYLNLWRKILFVLMMIIPLLFFNGKTAEAQRFLRNILRPPVVQSLPMKTPSLAVGAETEKSVRPAEKAVSVFVSDNVVPPRPGVEVKKPVYGRSILMKIPIDDETLTEDVSPEEILFRDVFDHTFEDLVIGDDEEEMFGIISHLEEEEDEEENPEEFSDDIPELILTVPFEMEGSLRVSEAELDDALTLPEEKTAENLADFIFRAESLDPDAEMGEDESAQNSFFSKIAAAKWNAAWRMMEMKELSPEMLTVAVETLLGVAFHEPEIYLERVRTLPEILRKRDARREAWKVEDGLLQLEASLLSRREFQNEAEKQEVFANFCRSLISLLQKGRKEGVAEEEDMLMPAITLMIYAEMLPTEEKCEFYTDFSAMTENVEDDSVRRCGILMKHAVRRMNSVDKRVKIVFSTASGKKIKTADSSAKMLLLFFWSMENEESLRELSALKAIYPVYHEKGLEILGIALGENSEELAEFLENEAFPWEMVLPAEEDFLDADEDFAKWQKTPAVFLGILETPAMVLLGPEGRMISGGMNFEELAEVLEKDFGK